MIRTIFKSTLLILATLLIHSISVRAEGPSYDCGKTEKGSVEEIVCNDPTLSELDVKMAKVYKEAEEKAQNEQPPVLKAEQRGWIKGRNECWKSQDEKECIKENYLLRIAELQARYQLIEGKGPIYYGCDGNPKNEVVITFYETDPPTLVAEYGDSTSLMYLNPSGSGSMYEGRNETVWIKGKEARVKWGFDSQIMNCKEK